MEHVTNKYVPSPQKSVLYPKHLTSLRKFSGAYQCVLFSIGSILLKYQTFIACTMYPHYRRLFYMKTKYIVEPGPASTEGERPPTNPAIRVRLPPPKILLSCVFKSTHLYGTVIYLFSEKAKAPSTGNGSSLQFSPV